MATTAVFAEILIIGLQVETWVVLALLTVFGTGWIELGDVKDFASLTTVVVLALAYVLGIIVDRLTDTLLDRLERTKAGGSIKRRLSKSRKLELPADVATMRMVVLHESDGMTRFLDYQRSRWRITRATVVNLAIAGPLAALYVATRTDDELWALAPVAGTLVLVPATYFAGVRIQDAWVERLVDAYNIIIGKKPQRRSRGIVAAVCHRRAADTVELLLVRTKKGKRWTFPKGHVEPGERRPEAAAREALEEAGAEGDVAATPFTHYRYPGTRANEGEALVAAYLLAVTEQCAPASGERNREPTWVSPERATRLLAEGGREPEYANEHARVVREAVAALKPS